MSTLVGNEFVNARPKFGYTAGAYYSYPLNSKLGIYSEFVGNFKGSKFNNDIDEYSKIALFYLDMPLMLEFKLGEEKSSGILVGINNSYLALSSVFVGAQRKAAFNEIALKRYDLGAVAYYHVYGDYVSFQFGIKQSVLNANNGVNFVDIDPATGNNGPIRNLTFEIGMFF